MIKNAEIHTNGTTAAPNRLALNRLGPQKSSAMSTVKKLAEPNEYGDDTNQNRLTAKKLAEDKARARTVARAQAVAEKLSDFRCQWAQHLPVARDRLRLFYGDEGAV